MHVNWRFDRPKAPTHVHYKHSFPRRGLSCGPPNIHFWRGRTAPKSAFRSRKKSQRFHIHTRK